MPEDRLPRLELHTLGGIQLRPGESVDASALLSQDKRLGVLLYLALARLRGFHRRDVLLGLFWADLSQFNARHALSQSIYVIRQTLGNDLVIGRGTELSLNFDRLWIDAEAFRESVDQGDFATALDLYRGPLLNGFYLSDAPEFERWADQERSYHLDLAITAARKFAEQCMVKGDFRAATERLRWATSLAPLDEPLRLDLIRLLSWTGDRSGAMRELAGLLRDLREELGVEPSAETEAVAAELGDLNGTTASRTEGNVAPQLAIPQVVTIHPSPASGLWRPHWLATGVLVATALLLAAIFLLPRSGVPTSVPDIPFQRLLVAPFTVATGQVDDSSLVRGVADWMAAAIAATGLLEVVGPGAVQRLPRETQGNEHTSLIDPVTREAAQRSRADLVLIGTVQTRNDSVVWRARLVEPSTSRVLRTVEVATDKAAHPMTGVEALGDRILGALGTVVDARFSVWAGRTSQPSSYQAYRQFADGLDSFHAGESLRAAALFEKAAGPGGTFTPAVLWAAWAHIGHFYRGGGIHLDRRARADSLLASLESRRATMSPWEAALHDHHAATSRYDYQAAYHAMTRVVQQSPDLHWQFRRLTLVAFLDRPREMLKELDGIDSDARWLGGYEVRYWSYKAWAYHRLENYQEELELAQRRLADNPADRWARRHRFRALAGLGRLEDARQILATGPMMGMGSEMKAHGLGEELQEIGRESLSRLEARPENDRDDEWHYDMGNALTGLDRLDEAAEHLRSVPHESPRWLDAAGELGWVLARLGEHDEARRLSTELEAIEQEAWRFLLQAKIAAALGEKDRAVGLIARMSCCAGLHMIIEPLIGYPPFEELRRPKG